jgi:ribosome biogenesis protein ERB1
MSMLELQALRRGPSVANACSDEDETDESTAAGESAESAEESAGESADDGSGSVDDDDTQYSDSDPEEEIKTDEEKDSSSSEDESIVNTIGNVPMRWYEHEDHIGYDREGKKILRKTNPQDRIDGFLNHHDNKKGWRTVYDELNDDNVVLSPKEVEILTRMDKGMFPHSEMDAEERLYTYDKEIGGIHPLINATEPKACFVPSKWEAKQVIKIIRAMRRGAIKAPESEEEKLRKQQQGYLLWGDDGQADGQLSKSARTRKLMQVSAPKPMLPGHAESYNPPAEYLPSQEELMQVHPHSMQRTDTRIGCVCVRGGDPPVGWWLKLPVVSESRWTSPRRSGRT